MRIDIPLVGWVVIATQGRFNRIVLDASHKKIAKHDAAAGKFRRALMAIDDMDMTAEQMREVAQRALK